VHIEQLNVIIEDLQQRLLDQEMEVESCKAEVRRASVSTSTTVGQEVCVN